MVREMLGVPTYPKPVDEEENKIKTITMLLENQVFSPISSSFSII